MEKQVNRVEENWNWKKKKRIKVNPSNVYLPESQTLRLIGEFCTKTKKNMNYKFEYFAAIISIEFSLWVFSHVFYLNPVGFVVA